MPGTPITCGPPIPTPLSPLPPLLLSGLRADSEALLAQSLVYEDLALDLLDTIRESKDAQPLLCLLPWEWEVPYSPPAYYPVMLRAMHNS